MQLWLAVSEEHCSREGKGSCPPLEERPLMGGRGSHPRLLSGKRPWDAEEPQLAGAALCGAAPVSSCCVRLP